MVRKIGGIIVTKSNQKKVWWQCKKGHQWEASVSSRSLGRECPSCSIKKVSEGNSLSEKFPHLVSEWCSLNNILTPSEVSYASARKVFWRCHHGHTWEAVIRNRTLNSTGCPDCRRNKFYKSI